MMQTNGRGNGAFHPHKRNGSGGSATDLFDTNADENEINNAGDGAAGGGGHPTILVRAGGRHIAADQGLAAMRLAGVPFYQRDKKLVRICHVKAKTSDGKIIWAAGITRVGSAILGRALGQSANWQKLNRNGEVVNIDPPKDVAEQTAEMIEEWGFPPLTGVITCPTLRPDDSLLDQDGYDEATGLVLYKALKLPPIKETREAAVDAIKRLAALLDGFPFVNDESKAVALSRFLTPVLRGAFPVVPLHQTDAPEAGSGKSYLADLTSAIATGERCAVLAAGRNAEETEKRLIGAVITGHPLIFLDNVRTVLEGDFFCQVSERPALQLRPLGTSTEIKIPNVFSVFVNGNNLVTADDLVRRSIRASLDANSETPETRVFKTNPLAEILTHRGDFVAACLTIARAYLAAGSPGRLTPLASYEPWSDLVRSALCWLDYPDPVATMATIRGADPVRQERGAIFEAWGSELSLSQSYLVAEVVEAAESAADLALTCVQHFSQWRQNVAEPPRLTQGGLVSG